MISRAGADKSLPQTSSRSAGSTRTGTTTSRFPLACQVRIKALECRSSHEPLLTLFAVAATWLHVKRDLLQNRDPDYDSDEEGGWPFDQLSTFSVPGFSTKLARSDPLPRAVRRTMLTMVNPATGRRESAKEFKEFDEWARRRENGDGEQYEEDEGEGEVAGSEMGDAE